MYSGKRSLVLEGIESGDQDGQMPVLPFKSLLSGICISLAMWAAIIGFLAWMRIGPLP